MKFKNLVLASLLAMASFSASAATQTLTLNAAGTAGFNNDVIGHFVDDYLFSVPSNTIGTAVGSAISSVSVSFYPSISLNFPNLTDIGIWTADGATRLSAPALLTSAGLGVPGNILGLTFSTGLTSGDYKLQVVGDATVQGSYGGTFTLTTVPVPEAETYSMMLLGLGLMGFIAARRRVA